VKDVKPQPDWSRPPQAGIGRHGGSRERSEPSLGKGFLIFLVLTVGPFLLGNVFPDLFSYGLMNLLFWFVPLAAGFYFFVGIVIIPLVALFQLRKFRKLLAIILRSVNSYIAVSYGVVFSLLVGGLKVPFLEKLVQGTLTMFGLGYFVVIIVSAELASAPTPDPPRPEFDPILEGLEDFHPTDVGRVQDGIARF
jgi:hypothetical protein